MTSTPRPITVPCPADRSYAALRAYHERRAGCIRHAAELARYGAPESAIAEALEISPERAAQIAGIVAPEYRSTRAQRAPGFGRKPATLARLMRAAEITPAMARGMDDGNWKAVAIDARAGMPSREVRAAVIEILEAEEAAWLSA